MVSSERNQASLRSAAKQASRARDERDRASGRKSAKRLRRENESFAQLAGLGRVELVRCRSLG